MNARKSPSKGKGGSSGGGKPRGKTDDELHEDAMRVLNAEYYAGVRGIAQELADRVKSGDIADQDAWQDALHQSVDGSYWVIYTHANFQVLMCSNHHDAYSEEYGEAPVSGDSVDWAKAAFAALMQDVQEHAEQPDFDNMQERRGRRMRAPLRRAPLPPPRRSR